MITNRLAVAPTPPGWVDAIPQAQFHQALSLLGLLLTPVAVAAATLAAWRFGVDTGWTRTFFIANGFLSHWQVWCAFAFSMQACAYSLGRGSAARAKARSTSGRTA